VEQEVHGRGSEALFVLALQPFSEVTSVNVVEIRV